MQKTPAPIDLRSKVKMTRRGNESLHNEAGTRGPDDGDGLAGEGGENEGSQTAAENAVADRELGVHLTL